MRIYLCAAFFVAVVVSYGISSPIISCYFEKDRPTMNYLKEAVSLCTHLFLIGSCTLDERSRVVLPTDDVIDEMILLKKSSNIKILVTFTPSNRLVSQLVLDRNLTTQFVSDVSGYLVKKDIDGFDVDWEFPVWSSDAAPTDRTGLNFLLRHLRKSFSLAKEGLLLTAAVAAPYRIVKKAYDIEELKKHLDFIQIMNYDYHIFSKREPFVGFNAPLFKEVYEFGPLSKLNSDYSTRFWLASGMPASKIVFGIPTYGRGYTLLYSWLHFPYSPAVGSAHLGASYSYHEVCKLDHNSTYKYVFNRRARSPYLYGGNKQWLGFEHSSSVFIKAAYARYMQLAGIMVFDIGSDDYQGYCGGDRYPLLKAARAGFLNLSRKNL